MSEPTETPAEENENTEAAAASEASTGSVIPEIKQIIGSILFASTEPVSTRVIYNTFKKAAANYEETMAAEFKGIKTADVNEAMQELIRDMDRAKTGVTIVEVAGGFRLQNDKDCGLWIRTYLDKGKIARLSKPALETLAVVAYRQPCTRSDVEAVRGVSVDSMIRNLLEMQLVKVVGRSELPGRPWLFGTTQKFMEHFGLKELEELPGVQELRRQPVTEPVEGEVEEDVVVDAAEEGELDFDEASQAAKAEAAKNAPKPEPTGDPNGSEYVDDDELEEDLLPEPEEEE